MFLYTKNAIALSKTNDVESLAMELLKSNTPYDIAMMLAEKICADKPQKRVVVSQEDMDTILSVFRVRGVDVDGKPIKRGRKRLDAPKDNYEE